MRKASSISRRFKTADDDIDDEALYSIMVSYGSYKFIFLFFMYAPVKISSRKIMDDFEVI